MLEVDIEKKLGRFQLSTHFSTSAGFFSLLGPSGCGKSLSLKCIAGIEKPDSGRIVLEGKVLFDSDKGINLPPQKRNAGYLFQSYALFPTMSVRSNLLMGLKNTKSKKEKEERLTEIANLLEISENLDQRPNQLSGGQKQRVALGRMLLSHPELILLDEPFSALDAYLKDSLIPDFLHLLRNYGKQVILVTHSMEEAFRISDETSLMSNGKIMRIGKTEDVFHNPMSINGARITGYRNISRAEKLDSNTLFAIDWNNKFTFDAPLPDTITGIAIKEDSFSFSESLNSSKINIDSIEKSLNGDIVYFHYEGGKSLCSSINSEVSDYIGVNPSDIILLTE